MPSAELQTKSASLAWLAGRDNGVRFVCLRSTCDHKAARYYGLSLHAREAAQRWGGETTMNDLRRRAVCKLCGSRWPKIEVEISRPTPTMGVRQP